MLNNEGGGGAATKIGELEEMDYWIARKREAERNLDRLLMPEGLRDDTSRKE